MTFDARSTAVIDRLVESRLGTTELLQGLEESWRVSDARPDCHSPRELVDATTGGSRM